MEQKDCIKEYHQDGSIFKEYHVNDMGQKNGSYKGWWQTGQQEIDCTFVNGKYNSIYKRWYSNGKIDFIDQNKNGDRHGIRIEFEHKHIMKY